MPTIKGELKPEKPKTDGRVICTCCQEFSGWTNDELIYVTGNRSLKCNNCGKVCIEVKCQKASDKEIKSMIDQVRLDQIAEQQRRKEIYIERGFSK